LWAENNKFGLNSIDYESKPNFNIGGSKEVRIELKILSRKYYPLFSNNTWISISYALNNILIDYHTLANLSLLNQI